ncbi:MAG: hypothetical protein M3137_05085 [Actinomycetota bacterium]|nr:hypothetical protein [Actinomycetota bacterium]
MAEHPGTTAPSSSALDARAPERGDPLAEIDRIMGMMLAEDQQAVEETARLSAERSEFAIEFTRACKQHVRPPMDAIIGRLRDNGGGGVIVERPEDLSSHHWHRLTLWMSLSGEIAGTPRPDRHPFLQLDADVNKRAVRVSEGDMWRGHGGNRSGPAGQWTLAEMTADLVGRTAVDILRRSAGQM